MNSLAFGKSSKTSYQRCSELIAMAERELSALFGAVTERFGSRQAELSAEEWLGELVNVNDLPASAREWRAITAKVLSKLAGRVSASSLSTELKSA
jgi:hypothetical protein